MQQLTALKELFDQYEAQRKTFQERGAAALKEALGEFFKVYPDVAAIRWRQYTPYFNDGDACVFSVRDLEYLVKGNDPDGNEYGEWRYLWHDYTEKRGVSEASYRALQNLDAQIHGMEEVLKGIFGDHVQITVTKDGVRVKEYDHE